MPPKDMLRRAHDGRFPRIPDHVAEKLVPEAPEEEQEEIYEKERAKMRTMHHRVDLQLYPATEKVTLELHPDSDEDVMIMGEKVAQWHAPLIKAEPIDEGDIPSAPPGSKWDDSEAESIATVSSVDYDQTKVANVIQRLAKLLPMVGNAYRDIAEELLDMSTTQCHNLFQNLPLVPFQLSWRQPSTFTKK